MISKHDVIIVGSGLAGLRAALEVASHLDVAVISKVVPHQVPFRRCPGWHRRGSGK